MNKFCVAALILVVLSINACQNRENAYLQSESVPTLKVPKGLSKDKLADTHVIAPVPGEKPTAPVSIVPPGSVLSGQTTPIKKPMTQAEKGLVKSEGPFVPPVDKPDVDFDVLGSDLSKSDTSKSDENADVEVDVFNAHTSNAELVKTKTPTPELWVNGPYDPVWKDVGQALSDLGYQISVADSTRGVYSAMRGRQFFEFDVFPTDEGTIVTVKAYDESTLTTTEAKKILDELAEKLK